MEEKKGLVATVNEWFVRFEKVVTIILSSVIALIIVISLIRIIESFFTLFFKDFLDTTEITFEDYQFLFGKIMTLILSMEFMASILKVLKNHNIVSLVQDVVLITALAIARKLIIYEYDKHQPLEVISLGVLLIAIGIFYYLIRNKTSTRLENPNLN